MEYNGSMLHKAVSQQVGEGLGSDMIKKRLAVTCNGELFLVHRCPVYFKAKFKIYKMNDERNKWDKVKGIGDDRVLFVASDHCFFANTKDLPGWRGNSMVFHTGVFPCYSNRADPEFFEKGHSFTGFLDIAVFHFDTRDYKHIGSHPRYSGLFRPQPAWVVSHSQLFNNMSAAEKQVARGLYSRVGASPNLNLNTRGPRIINMDSFPAIKVTENGASQGAFRGVRVCPNFVPVLQKIWDEYGDLIERDVVKSEGLQKWALESIAKMVIILQTNSSESLNESQVEYLNTTLDDLQFLNIRLGWLIPFVRRALD